jgi:hypothetical protein
VSPLMKTQSWSRGFEDAALPEEKLPNTGGERASSAAGWGDLRTDKQRADIGYSPERVLIVSMSFDPLYQRPG